MRNEGNEQEQLKPAEPGPGVPPNHCRIVGTIVSVNVATGDNNDDPCSKAPCIAVVKVEEILGYGSAFGTPLAKGQEIQIQFRYTLGPTKGLFPNMLPAMPGLQVGSRFQADMQAAAVISESKVRGFSVGSYSVR